MTGVRWLPAVIALLGVTTVPYLLSDPAAAPEVESELQPPVLTGCVRSNKTMSIGSSIHGADRRAKTSYQCGDISLQLDVAQYLTQHTGKEAVTEGNMVVDTRLVSAARPIMRTLASGFAIREYRLDRLDHPATLWSWYAVGDRPFAEAGEAKVQELLNAVMLAPEDAAILTLVAWGDEHEATQTLTSVAIEIWDWYLLRAEVS